MVLGLIDAQDARGPDRGEDRDPLTSRPVWSGLEAALSTNQRRIGGAPRVSAVGASGAWLGAEPGAHGIVVAKRHGARATTRWKAARGAGHDLGQDEVDRLRWVLDICGLIRHHEEREEPP